MRDEKSRKMTQYSSKKFLFAVSVGASLLGVAPASFAGNGTKADSATYYLELGRTQAIARRYSDAWRNLEKAAQFDPKNATVQKELAAVCFKMNRMAPAIRALETAVAIDPSDKHARLDLLKHYFHYGQWEQTVTAGARVKSEMPDEKSIDWMLGKAQYMLQDYGKAVTHLKAALREDSKNAEANYVIARSLTIMSNYSAAVPYYEAALTLDPTQGSRAYEFAMVLATAGQADKSVEWFQKALDAGHKPRDDFYMNMAYTMADAKRTDEAIVMLDKVLAKRPMDVGLLYGIADVCYHSKQYKRAISYWDRVLEFDKANARSLYMIGMCYQKMGKNEEGMALCDRAIGLDPSLAVLKHKREMQ
jgi:tetratricopeptide (TPR) repeat protein